MEAFEEEFFYDADMNQHGFPQTYQQVGGASFPVCSSCHAMTMLNRGQGTACDTCQHEAFMHASHDYED